jgi:hypothetical protein
MMKRKLLSLIVALVVFAGCGSEKTSRPIVAGYDEFGHYQVTEGLLESERCPLIGSIFADLCLESGAQNLKVRGCADLCSINVASDGS